jgi:glycosyl transferase family 25
MNAAIPSGSPSLLQVFDRISIINLPERADRRRAVTRELARCGLPVDGDRVRFVDGIRPDGPGEFPSTGARGCYLSHLKVLKQAQADGVHRLLVLEDDVMFTPLMATSQPLAAALATQDDWDLAYPGHIQAPLTGPLRWERSLAPLVCAHCYAVHARTLPLIIDYLEACLTRPAGDPVGGPMHFDGALSMLRAAHPGLITWLASRSLAVQRSSRSDIAGPSWIDKLPLADWARSLRNLLRRQRQA